jgi:hypothetical protein
VCRAKILKLLVFSLKAGFTAIVPFMKNRRVDHTVDEIHAPDWVSDGPHRPIVLEGLEGAWRAVDASFPKTRRNDVSHLWEVGRRVVQHEVPEVYVKRRHLPVSGHLDPCRPHTEHDICLALPTAHGPVRQDAGGQQILHFPSELKNAPQIAGG